MITLTDSRTSKMHAYNTPPPRLKKHALNGIRCFVLQKVDSNISHFLGDEERGEGHAPRPPIIF